MEILAVDARIEASRAHWYYRGQQRPEFAQPIAPGEESVWDFPRPPVIVPVAARVRVEFAGQEIANSSKAVRVCETAGAPTYYLAPTDVDVDALIEVPGQSLCEWKGVATSYACAADPKRASCAWAYHRVFPEFVEIADWYSFYPTVVACFVAHERVQPQPGGYYGGWVTANLKGPIKGEPGSQGW